MISSWFGLPLLLSRPPPEVTETDLESIQINSMTEGALN